MVTEEAAREIRVELVSLEQVVEARRLRDAPRPLNEKTKNLIDAKQLAAMKPTRGS